MLQNIRDNSQGWIAKAIIGVIIVLLSLTGFDAIIRATNHSNVAAEVNGENISLNEVQQAVDIQRRQLLQRLGKDFDPSMVDDKLLKEVALKGLIERTLLLQAAKKDKFVFSEQAVDRLILQAPEFQVDGKFSPDRFDQVIRQMGYTRLQFRQMLGQEMLVGQLRTGLAGTGFVTDSELQAFTRLEKQTRDFAILTVKAAPLESSVSNNEVKVFYEGHKDEFMSPEQVVVEYIELKKSAFLDQVKVKQEDLNMLYQKEIANLSEQRDAAHILVEVNDKVNDQEAKTKLEEIKTRLVKGEDFSTLAEQFSQDAGSARNGGELGYASRGIYDPTFESVLYALRQGEVSAPVKTPYGYHLIKLLGIRTPEVPSLESLKPKLEEELKKQMVEQRFAEATRELESSAYEAADLNQPAQEMGLKVQISRPFGRAGGEGIAANRQIVRTAFSPEVLEDAANSGAVELDPDTVVILRVKEYDKPKEQMLEQVATNIRARLVAAKAAGAAKVRGEALIAGLREGRTPVAGNLWKVFEAADRGQSGVDPKLLQTVFRMQRSKTKGEPTFSGVALANGDYVVIRLDGVSEMRRTLSDGEKAMYRRFLASRSGQEDFAAFRRQLQDKSEIEKY